MWRGGRPRGWPHTSRRRCAALTFCGKRPLRRPVGLLSIKLRLDGPGKVAFFSSWDLRRDAKRHPHFPGYLNSSLGTFLGNQAAQEGKVFSWNERWAQRLRWEPMINRA